VLEDSETSCESPLVTEIVPLASTERRPAGVPSSSPPQAEADDSTGTLAIGAEGTGGGASAVDEADDGAAGATVGVRFPLSCVPSEAKVSMTPVAPYVIAFKPYEAVFGMIVTGRRRTLVKPARTFFLTWAGFDDARKVGSDTASADAV
jgi:hypothetical protein